MSGALSYVDADCAFRRDVHGLDHVDTSDR